jgi:predicted dinucleotide-binding enzyme
MKIGVIGCGSIGSAIARHWANAGHDLIVSAKHLDHAEKIANKLRRRATVSTPEQAAKEGEVILLSIPLGEIPLLSKSVKNALRGKVVIDTSNPYPERDGEAADEVIESHLGTGIWTAEQIPGARIVRAFSSVHAEVFETQAHRKEDPIGVPIASDDAQAIEVVVQLIHDAGFEAIVLGGLKEARRFDPGTETYGSDLGAKKLREKFGEVA